ncbi:galacturonosyltransferase 14 [Hordeum vulgare]|nr:galacturonosyltransferase 14 [Hordeum vulgare]
MEAFQPADLVIVEVVHAQSRLVDLVAGHVAPTPSVANVPARKQQSNVVVQANISTGPVRREGASGAATPARSGRSPAGKMNKVLGVKRKKLPTKKPSATPSAPARRSLTVPSYDAASTVGEVFDETFGSCGSNNATAEFVHLLATNAVDIDQAPIGGFDYNELEGGIDDHGGEDEVDEIDEGMYQQSQGKKH